MPLSHVDICKEGAFVHRHSVLRSPDGMVHEWRPREDQRRYMVRHDQIFTVEVVGRRPLQPMNPLNAMPQPFVPWAVSNPIWVDTDGNGRFDVYELE